MDKNLITPATTSSNGSLPVSPQEPEKYIRTFAGDIQTFKEGGSPDLIPLAEQGASSPSPLKTYSGDFADRIKQTDASAATVLAVEQDSTPRNSSVPEESSRSGLFYILGGTLLLVVGVVGAYIAYTRYLAALAPVVLTSGVSAPIFVDEQEKISGEGEPLLQAIVQSVGRPLAANTVRLLYVASTSTGSVFGALPVSAPDILLRNVTSEGSMAGVVSVSGTQSPFFILAVTSYSNTFSGMLSWEAGMPRNFSKLFPAYPPLPVSMTATSSLQATTTTLPNNLSNKISFRDEVVSNHDVRIYRDEGGRSILLYGYWNQKTLVIARDPGAFIEIIQRLATSRTQ